MKYGCFGALLFFLPSIYNYCVLPRLKIFSRKLYQKHRILVYFMRLSEEKLFLDVGKSDKKLKLLNFPQYSSFY